jgi:hypothetical protein
MLSEIAQRQNRKLLKKAQESVECIQCVFGDEGKNALRKHSFEELYRSVYRAIVCTSGGGGLKVVKRMVKDEVRRVARMWGSHELYGYYCVCLCDICLLLGRVAYDHARGVEHMALREGRLAVARAARAARERGQLRDAFLALHFRAGRRAWRPGGKRHRALEAELPWAKQQR